MLFSKSESLFLNRDKEERAGLWNRSELIEFYLAAIRVGGCYSPQLLFERARVQS